MSLDTLVGAGREWFIGGDEGIAMSTENVPTTGAGGSAQKRPSEEREALADWASEGGSVPVADEKEARPAKGRRKAKQDSITNVDDNAKGRAATSQTAKDDAAEAAGSPAEEGGQG